MDAAATTNSDASALPQTPGSESPPPAQAPAGGISTPVPASAPAPPLAVHLSANISGAWPRSAQLGTAFLLGLALALLGIQMWSMSRWSTRPLDLEGNKPSRYRIDLNLASREQLLQVPGIGDRTAEKIETFREKQGPFRSKTELTQIEGIGPAKYEKMEDWLTVQSAEVKTDSDSAPVASQPKRSVTNQSKSSSTRTRSKKEESIKEPIDVNQADLKDLQKLPGIGPKLAQRIVDERAKSPFRAVEDLRRVSGIGPKILERLRPFVKVRPASNQFALDSAGKSR